MLDHRQAKPDLQNYKTPDFVASVEIPRGTAHRLVQMAKENGLLRELIPGSGRRPAVVGGGRFG
jgi:hypothetical protein